MKFSCLETSTPIMFLLLFIHVFSPFNLMSGLVKGQEQIGNQKGNIIKGKRFLCVCVEYDAL